LWNTIQKLTAKALTKFGHKPIWQIPEGHVIEPAFISGGIQYYRLKDYFNTFSLRGLTALQVYEEWNMRMTKEHLSEFIELMDKNLNNPREIRIGEIARIVNILKERINYIMPTTEIVYKFASVAFFDKNESPYSYDPEYCKQKINRWKEEAEISDFFIVMLLKDMIPLPQLSEVDLKICLNMIDEATNLHSLNRH
jgi:abortive infection bacteriophage resistance protein